MSSMLLFVEVVCSFIVKSTQIFQQFPLIDEAIIQTTISFFVPSRTFWYRIW